MCVAPLERWPKLVSLMLLCHQRDSEGLCGPLRRFLVSGNGNRCKKCSVLSYVLLCTFRWCVGHADAARAVVDSRSSPRLVGKDGL